MEEKKIIYLSTINKSLRFQKTEQKTSKHTHTQLTLQLVGAVVLLLLLCEGLLQPTNLLLVFGGRAPPVLQLRPHAAQVGLQGRDLPLPLRCGCLHGVPQDKNLMAETQSISDIIGLDLLHTDIRLHSVQEGFVSLCREESVRVRGESKGCGGQRTVGALRGGSQMESQGIWGE